MKKWLGIFLCIVGGMACTRELDVSNPNTPIGNFEALWQTIDTKYCFVEEKGINWQAIHDEYEPQVRQLKADDDRELFDLFAAMLDSLADGHVNLYSAFDRSRSRRWWEGYPDCYDAAIVYDNYLTPTYKIAGGLYYNRIANDSIGYIRYESFTSAFSNTNMYYVLSYFADCKGLIVDVRHNGGGDMDNAFKLAATFFREDKTVGYWNHKTGSGHYDYSALEELRVKHNDAASHWYRPVIVLADRETYSAANLFVNCMRYADNAAIVGGITGGGGGMPLSYELPNGWLLRFSSVKMYDADKKSIEEGIKPHREIAQTSANKDDLIDFSVDVIMSLYEKK